MPEKKELLAILRELVTGAPEKEEDLGNSWSYYGDICISLDSYMWDPIWEVNGAKVDFYLSLNALDLSEEGYISAIIDGRETEDLGDILEAIKRIKEECTTYLDSTKEVA